MRVCALALVNTPLVLILYSTCNRKANFVPQTPALKTHSCVIVVRAWENVAGSGRVTVVTPVPLVKKSLCCQTALSC